MPRSLYVSLIAALAICAPIHAQANEPPKYVKNGIGMKFVWIPPGTFTMGSPKQEKGRSDLETQHVVKLTEGFYMSAYPVTQDQWRAVMADAYGSPAEGFDIVRPSRFVGRNKLPVEMVSWNDCQAFIKCLGKREKRRYRLPTEAEWEYACRAGTATPYCFGESITAIQANFAGAALRIDGKRFGDRKATTPVGSFPPNAWGLYDMHGNVAQWCQDRFGKYPPKNAVDPQGPDTGGSRILRGGSWEVGPAHCRSASRAWDSPDNRGSGSFGFRICVAADEPVRP